MHSLFRRRSQAVDPPVQNPFVAAPMAPQSDVEPQPEVDEVLGEQIALAGPSRPESAPPVDVAHDDPWPRRDVPERPLICVMGLHGGAGATTLAGLLGEDAVDVGRSWPVATGWERPLPSLAVLAVARTHHAGLSAAERFARLWAAGTLTDSTLLGLVLVDDGPRLTAPQRAAARRLAQMTPHGWHLPWNELWRIEPAVAHGAPIRTRQVIKNIRAHARNIEGNDE